MPTIYTRHVRLAAAGIRNEQTNIVMQCVRDIYSDMFHADGPWSLIKRTRWSDQPDIRRHVFDVLDQIGDKTSLKTLEEEFDKHLDATLYMCLLLQEDVAFDSGRACNCFWELFFDYVARCGGTALISPSVSHLAALRIEYRRHLGITTDCRTHRDIPRRNMFADTPPTNAVTLLRRNPRQARILGQLLDEVHSIDQLRNCLAAA